MDDLNETYLNSYSSSSQTKKLIEKVPILLLVGPTGSGKNTIALELVKTGKFYDVPTYTTREPRYNHGVLEKSGDDYYFIKLAKAKEMLKKREFFEAAINHGNLYATSAEEIAKAAKLNKVAVMDIDIKGVRSFMSSCKNATPIFLLPPSFEILLERLNNRYQDDHKDLKKDIEIRLGTALEELEELINTDYYVPVINDNLSHTISTVLTILNNQNYDVHQKEAALQLAQDIKKSVEQYLEKNYNRST